MALPWSMVSSSSDRRRGDMDDGDDDDTENDDTDDDTDDDHDDDDTDDDNDHNNDSYTAAGVAPGASFIHIYNIKSISIIKIHFSQYKIMIFSKDRSASLKLSF